MRPGRMAQLEHRPYPKRVVGSSPAGVALETTDGGLSQGCFSKNQYTCPQGRIQQTHFFRMSF